MTTRACAGGRQKPARWSSRHPSPYPPPPWAGCPAPQNIGARPQDQSAPSRPVASLVLHRPAQGTDKPGPFQVATVFQRHEERQNLETPLNILRWSSTLLWYLCSKDPAEIHESSSLQTAFMRGCNFVHSGCVSVAIETHERDMAQASALHQHS